VSEMRINTSAFIKLKTNQFGMNLFIKWKRWTGAVEQGNESQAT
jgi:hypothetical protein